jgi:hypothetical protein
MKRPDIMQAAVGACLTGGAHVCCGVIVAGSLWVGRDSPAEWTFYYASAEWLLLPITGTLAWLLSRTAKMKRVGQGAFVGLLAATAIAVLAMLIGYAPPWISEGWSGDGWS